VKILTIGLFCWFIFFLSGCTVKFAGTNQEKRAELAHSKTLVIYDKSIIPEEKGISTGEYIKVDGYRYANIFVEFGQETADEKPVSMAMVFYPGKGGQGARRYFSFSQGSPEAGKPVMLTAGGENSWHGGQWKKSSYIMRVPVMGAYMQLFPFNHHNKERELSVLIYLTD
jgi:hypothetical protein